MGLTSVLSKIGKVAQTVAVAGAALGPLLPQGMAASALVKYGPVAISIVMTLIRNVLAAEALEGSAKGAAKKAHAANMSTPEMIRLIEAMVGRDLVDEDRMKKVADKGIEFMVELLNALPDKEQE